MLVLQLNSQTVSQSVSQSVSQLSTGEAPQTPKFDNTHSQNVSVGNFGGLIGFFLAEVSILGGFKWPVNLSEYVLTAAFLALRPGGLGVWAFRV